MPAQYFTYFTFLLLVTHGSQSCGHQQLDMLSLLLGRSRPDEQVVKVFPVLLVQTVRDDTSQLSWRRRIVLAACPYHWAGCHGATDGDQFDLLGGRRSDARARPAGFDWCAARRWFGLISYIRMQRLGDTLAHTYYGTPYMGTDGRWNGCEQPDRPRSRGYEGGAERGGRCALPTD